MSVCAQSFSHSDCATPWTVTYQVPLSMGFSRQEYRSGLPFPILVDLPDPGIELKSPALADGFFATEPPGRPLISMRFGANAQLL